MLKSEQLIVAFRDEIVVWRWRIPAPVEFLFMNRKASTFFVKAAGMLTQWQIKAPHGALAVATGVVTCNQPMASLQSLVDTGVAIQTPDVNMPVWISDLDLDRMTLSEAQQQLLCGAASQSTITLEF